MLRRIYSCYRMTAVYLYCQHFGLVAQAHGQMAEVPTGKTGLEPTTLECMYIFQR